MKYRVHRFDISMTRDQQKLEQFLNNLGGEVVAIIPNVDALSRQFCQFSARCGKTPTAQCS